MVNGPEDTITVWLTVQKTQLQYGQLSRRRDYSMVNCPEDAITRWLTVQRTQLQYG